MPQEKQLIDFNALEELGWPYTKTHTMRLTKPTILRTKGSRSKGTYREWIEPNPDPFPTPKKLGVFQNSALVWEAWRLLDYFKRHGLDLKIGTD
jgi:hypothetical protein